LAPKLHESSPLLDELTEKHPGKTHPTQLIHPGKIERVQFDRTLVGEESGDQRSQILEECVREITPVADLMDDRTNLGERLGRSDKRLTLPSTYLRPDDRLIASGFSWCGPGIARNRNGFRACDSGGWSGDERACDECTSR
jgi:hypothetical protein